MDNLYNVIIFFDDNDNFDILKHFKKHKNIKKNMLPSIYKKKYTHGCMSPQARMISPTKNKLMFPNIYTHNNKLKSPIKNKANSPCRIKIRSPYRIKKLIIKSPPYNKNVFDYDVFNLKDISNKLIKQNTLTRDGIIIILKNTDKINLKIVADIANTNYAKPILILFDMTKNETKADNNKKKYEDAHFFEKTLKKDFTQKQINIQCYFPTISMVKNLSDNIKYININEKYEKNPIEIFVEQLHYKEAKTFSINPENYPEELLIKEFQNAILPIRLWTHYTKLKLIFEYLKIYDYKELINTNSILHCHWKKYTNNTGQEFAHKSIIYWLKIINNIKNLKYNNFNSLYLKNPKIHDENYYKILIQ